VNAVPDLEEMTALDPDDWVREEPKGMALDFVLFALGASLLLAFSFLNLYALPLGTVSVQALQESAPSIIGSEVEVFGIMTHSNEMEFTLADENSTATLDVVWLGAELLPLNGSRVVATGQIVQGTAGPAMMCSGIAVRIGSVASYENPWTLPSLRVVFSVMVWFVAMVFVAGALALLSLHKRGEAAKHRTRALTDICTVAGGVLTATIVAIILLEPSLSGAEGLFTYCAAAAFALLLLSSLSRRAKRADIAEMSNPMPVIAAIITLIGLLLSFLNVQSASDPTIFSEMAVHFQGSILVAAVGISGLICLGAYIARRGSELSAFEDSLRAAESGGS